MSSKSKNRDASEELSIVEALQKMEADPKYNTESRYHNNAEKYPGNIITFAETHMAYLKKFPTVDPTQYINNLKLITKTS